MTDNTIPSQYQTQPLVPMDSNNSNTTALPPQHHPHSTGHYSQGLYSLDE